MNRLSKWDISEIIACLISSSIVCASFAHLLAGRTTEARPWDDDVDPFQ